MKITFTLLLLACTLVNTNLCIAQNTVTPNDLNLLLGEWTGTLTYTDYRSNKPYSMPANLLVKQKSNPYMLMLNINYPNEPKANSNDKIKISKDGTHINKTKVTTRKNLPGGLIEIRTEYSGKDNNQNASIKNIYLIGQNKFVIRKEVKFENTDEWFMRNQYSYTR